jgi:uncharacterized protein with LGFP repeats
MIDHEIFRSVLGPDAPFNDQGAIYKFWRECRDQEQYLGAPITNEIEVGPGVVQQAFTSGAVIEWSAENGARLV